MPKVQVRGAERSRVTPARRTPLLWRHPHLIGAFVVEDPEGRLFLVFKRHGPAAWQRRVSWRCGVDMLLPAGGSDGMPLEELGYTD